MDNAIGWGATTTQVGQVPRKHAKRSKYVLQPARGKPESIPGQEGAAPFNASMLLDHHEPRFTVGSILDGLGLDPAQLNSWTDYLDRVLHQTNDVVMRQAMHQKMQSEQMVPEMRRVIWQRSQSYLKEMSKSMVKVYTPDQLQKVLDDDCPTFTLTKADLRGGEYLRHTPKPGGGYRYYYDEAKYDQSKDAHVAGDSAASSYITKTVQKQLEAAGTNGCQVSEMKSLVKRYGSKAVGKCLTNMKAEGGLSFKAGKFYNTQKKDEPKGSGAKQP